MASTRPETTTALATAQLQFMPSSRRQNENGTEHPARVAVASRYARLS